MTLLELAIIDNRRHAMDIEQIARRSLERVATRVGDVPECPYCGRKLTVRRTVIGLRPLVDGVQMKCAGPDGCGFRPDFDVPIDESTYETEMDLRDGTRAVDVVYDAGDDPDRDVDGQLAALGYHEGNMIENSNNVG